MLFAESTIGLQRLQTSHPAIPRRQRYRGEFLAAIPRFEEALAAFESLKDTFYCAILGCELGNCYLQIDEAERALEFFHKAERVFLESGAKPNYQVCLANIGNVYHYRREFLTAISYYQRALELARQLGDPSLDWKMAPQPRSSLHEPRKSGVGQRV